jgi:nitrogen fixation-related uncharacterized protein
MKKIMIGFGILSIAIFVLAFFWEPKPDDCEIEQPWGI